MMNSDNLRLGRRGKRPPGCHQNAVQTPSRVCLKIAFRQMCVTLCGRFGPDEGGVAGYVDRIGTKYATKWGVQMVEINL